MIGGTVVQVGSHKLGVLLVAKENQSSSVCGVIAQRDPKALSVSEGDQIWWQGDRIMWTPSCAGNDASLHDIQLRKIENAFAAGGDYL